MFLKYKIFSVTALAVLALSFANCSSGSATAVATGTVAGTSGTLKSADGAPISGAAVAITTSSASSLTKFAKNNHGQWYKLPQLTDADGNTCDDLSLGTSTVLAQDCTGSDGAYNLTGEIPCGETLTIAAKKGSFSISFTITLTCPSDADGDGEITDENIALDSFGFDDDCVVSSSDDSSTDSTDSDSSADDTATLVKGKPAYTIEDGSCNYDKANVAVVTGNYDEIENVLAKLGLGEVDSSGAFDATQDFDFTLVDGNDTLDDTTYDDFDDFVSNIDNLTPFDIIFLNCGNHFEDLSTDSSVKAVLQQYVEEGGKLYVTDWSYMFIEQNYSDFMNFLDGGTDPNTAETPITAAKAGTGGITSDATVADKLGSWLDTVTVNDGNIEDDCYNIDETTANAKTGARNDDDTVTIGDFLSSWVVMEGVHTGVTEEPTVWVTGPITHYTGSITAAPLTATRDEGDGRILYSSYHTAHSCPTTGFWPQERILQYLVFDL